MDNSLAVFGFPSQPITVSLFACLFEAPRAVERHTFSAFWLRSSVVSVLISLISGTWRMASHEFK